MNNTEISKCLAEVSALVAAGHPYEKCVQSRFLAEIRNERGYGDGWDKNTFPDWTDPNFEFRVAKGFVAGGNPIFDGMEFYNVLGIKLIACEEMRGDPSLANCTLTPPVPKVEIPEGFTAWSGGECPVAYDAKVTVIFRSGRQRTDIAHHLSWTHATTFNGRLTFEDIIAYKILKPTTFTLNGDVLPLPDYVGPCSLCTRALHWTIVGDVPWGYESKADADKVRAAFAKLTEGL